MRILVCVDGSKQGLKALEKAAEFAGGINIEDFAVIHVFYEDLNLSSIAGDYVPTPEDIERLKTILEKQKNENRKALADAAAYLEDKNIKVRSIYKEGHPADTILKVIKDEGFDTVIMGSRGLSGLKRIFLGSVSSAVIQGAENCTVVIVK